MVGAGVWPISINAAADRLDDFDGLNVADLTFVDDQFADKFGPLRSLEYD